MKLSKIFMKAMYGGGVGTALGLAGILGSAWTGAVTGDMDSVLPAMELSYKTMLGSGIFAGCAGGAGLAAESLGASFDKYNNNPQRHAKKIQRLMKNADKASDTLIDLQKQQKQELDQMLERHKKSFEKQEHIVEEKRQKVKDTIQKHNKPWLSQRKFG